MGKRNKKRRQEAAAQEETEEIEMVQCPTCDALIQSGLPACSKCGQEFIVEEDASEPEVITPVEEEIPVEEELPSITDSEPDNLVSAEESISDLDEEPDAAPEDIPADVGVAAHREEPIDDEDEEPLDDEPPKIKMTLLIIGTLLASASVLGVVLLRYGVIQTMFGYTASPGIGSQESMAILASVAPFAIGLFMIGFWGVKNDQIYVKTEKIKEASREKDKESLKAIDEPDEGDEGEAPESIPEIEVPQPAHAPEIAEEPEVEHTAPEPIAIRDVPEDLTEPLKELEEELADETTTPEPEDEIQLEQLLEEVMVDIEDDRGPEITSSALKEALADSLRVERCEKMLRAVVVLPDDKDRLRALIDAGISPSEFSDEVSKAVDRRKKKEKSREVTADEKAAILEDELVAELAELEEGFDKKNDTDDDDLEDQILKEIEDLEDL
jgi:hypothetical protein